MKSSSADLTFIAEYQDAFRAANPDRPVPDIVAAAPGWFRFSDMVGNKRRAEIEAMTGRLLDRAAQAAVIPGPA